MTQIVYKMWYNTNDPRLDKAVRKLKAMNIRRTKLQRALHPWWVVGWWILVAVLPTSLGVYLLIYGAWQLLALMAALWATYYAVVGVWLGISNLLRLWHLHHLHRDYFGAAIMWDPDPEWLAMQSALQARGLIMKTHLGNPLIAADLTEYLMASRHVRLRLRAAKRRPMPEHSDMQDLQRFADNFGALIAAKLPRN